MGVGVRVRARWDEGRGGVAAVHADRGEMGALEVAWASYVGGRIGSPNPAGGRVGTGSHGRAAEWLIVCGPDRSALEAAFSPAPASPALRR